MRLQKTRDGVGRVVNIIGYGALIPCFLMVFIVAFDVILRKLELDGINGSNELTTYLMVWVCMLGIPVLQYKDGHVWVNLLVNKFPYRFRCFWRCAIMAVETAVIALLAVGGYQKVMLFLEKTTTTDVLNMPKWIFAVAGFVAFAELFVLSFIDTIQLGIDGVKGEEPGVADDGWTDDQVKGI